MTALGKELRSFGTDWVYPITLMGFAILFWLMLAYLLDFSGTGSLLAMIAAIAGAFYYAHTQHPRFTLYEDGIAVMRKGQESRYRWPEITHFEGTRYSYGGYGIPIIKYGANHFHNGETRLFSVSVLTWRAGLLVEYILSKIAENNLPQLSKEFDADETDFEFGNFVISKAGIKHKKRLYSWEDLENVSIGQGEFPGVKMKFTQDKRNRRLGMVRMQSKYYLLGLIDHRLGTTYLPDAQAYLLDNKQQIQEAARQLAPLAIVIILIMAFFLGIVSIVRLSQGLPIFTPPCCQ